VRRKVGALIVVEIGCAKESIQAGIREVVFAEGEAYAGDLESVYRRLIDESGLLFRQHPATG
jgi:deoxycytidylate deaminase